jgi:hypothetical protein
MQLELFRFLEPTRKIDDLACWATIAGRFSRVAGYSAFGDFMLLDPISGEFAILLTLTAELEPTGFTNIELLKSEFLTHPEIIRAIGKPTLLAELETRLGVLKQDEAYFPLPYPSLGGSGAAETCDKGNVWIFADLVGQSHGLSQAAGQRHT